MHFEDAPSARGSAGRNDLPWWRELSRYQWFVFIVASLGWLFDTMDQQFFNLARISAVRSLLHVQPAMHPARATSTCTAASRPRSS